jgi:phosphoglycolate phosphatase-like HAD superfamily hydrolase
MTICAFDLDGTLITCEPRQQAVLRSVLVACGPVNLAAVWDRKRSGLSTRDALVSQGLSQASADIAAERWRERIEDYFWLQLDECLPSVRQTLRTLSQANAKLLLLTARSRPEWVRPQLGRVRLAEFFDEVFVVPSLHAVSTKAAILMREKADYYFGDTESDMAAARKAKVPAFIVGTGQRSESFLLSAGADAVFASLEDAVTQTGFLTGRFARALS